MLQHSVIIGLWTLPIPLGLSGIASGLDIRRRVIPNWIPISVLAWAILATAMHWNGLVWRDFVFGLGVGIAIGGLLFATGGFGGGDAKLIAALGAALGWKGILVTSLLMALAGGLLALLARLRGRQDYAYGPAITAGVAGYAMIYATAVWLLVRQHGSFVR